MNEPGFWVPYKTNDPKRACIVVGPFSNVHHANVACQSMRRAATPSEYVGEVLFASSEDVALRMALTSIADQAAERKSGADTRQPAVPSPDHS